MPPNPTPQGPPSDRTHSDIAAAYQIGVAQQVIQPGNNIAPHALVPAGMTLQPIREYVAPPPLPDFIAAAVVLADLPSFIKYTNRFKGPHALVFVTDHSLVAQLDYHTPANPMRNKHEARYALALSEEYQAWTAIHNKPVAQGDFALFLEERARDVVTPPSGAIMEIVLTLEAKTEIEFRSGKRLDNSTQQLQYVETQQARAGQSGNLEIPTELTINLPLFRHGEPVAITAKLRTILRDGKALFIVKLLGLETAKDDALARMIETVNKETQLPVLRGQP